METERSARSESTDREGGRFVRRIYAQRTIGLLLGLLCVVAVLLPEGIGPLGWTGILAAGLGWPHVAYLLSRRHPRPLAAEFRNLMVDSFVGGFFLPIISFNVVPSATFVAMLFMNNIGMGGVPLFCRGLVSVAAGVLTSSVFFGLRFQPEPTTLILIISTPMLILYPAMTGAIAYKFSEKLRQRRNELHQLYEKSREHASALESVNQELRLAEDKYRRLTEEINDTIFETDTNGTISYISPAIRTLSGHDPSEMIRREFYGFVYPDDLSEVERAFKAVLTGNGTPTEYRLTGKDGNPRWVRSSARPIFGNGVVAGIRGVLANIEDRKRAEEEKAEVLATIHARQKLEAIGTLAGGIAHDFNNILGAILGYSELALLKLGEDSEAGEDLREIVQAGERARELVKQILAFSRRRDGRRKPVRTHRVVQEALGLLRQAIPSTISIVSNLCTEEDTVVTDSTQVHQIVMNLCTNAYHAMRLGGGTLSVGLEAVEVSAPFAAETPDLKPGPHVRLTVSDTGTGMDSGTLSRVFEPFFTTKAQGEGTGLGLSVVHGIVRSHEGAIRIASRVGEGTRVEVYLPRHGAGARAAEGDGASAAVPGGKERILVVDDEPALARITQKLLSGLGYAVDSVTTSDEALALVLENPARFDLVLTDQTMPGMTGADLAKKVLEVRPELPVVICTGYSESLTEEKARTIGVKGFLNKPLDRSQLARAVREVLDAGAGRRQAQPNA